MPVSGRFQTVIEPVVPEIEVEREADRFQKVEDRVVWEELSGQ